MRNVFIIHGTGGSPEGNWFPWLKKELEKLGQEVFVPRFPIFENQNLDNWLETFEEYEGKINEETVFVGHSLGPAFILNLLERFDKKVKACFFVAGFVGLLGIEEFDKLNKTFISGKFDWPRIKKNCEKFYVINSNGDPYVHLEKGKFLAKKLGTEVILMKGAGHINADSGFTTFELLLDKIKEEL